MAMTPRLLRPRAQRALALGACLLTAACASQPAPAVRAEPARAPAPKAKRHGPEVVRWLAGESVVVLHVELAQARDLIPARSILGELFGAQRAQQALGQIQALHVGAALTAGDPQYTIVVEGEPPLAPEAQKERRAGREAWVFGDEIWARVGDRLWVGCLRHDCSRALIAPAQRDPSQRAPEWALPAKRKGKRAALELSAGIPRAEAGEEVRAYLHEKLPGVLEALEGGRLSMTRDSSGERETVVLSLVARFDLEGVAHHAALLLRMLAAGAAESLAQKQVPGDADALHGMNTDLDGSALRAELRLSPEQARVLAAVLWAAYQASTSAPAGPADTDTADDDASYAPPPEPPPPELRDQRVQAARREPSLGPLLDAVIAVAGDDLEVDAGSAGEAWLRVRVEKAQAQALTARLVEALSPLGATALRITRGYGGKPAELGVFARPDVLQALVVLGTGGKRGTALRETLARWQQQHGLSILLADRDYLSLELERSPGDPEATVGEFLKLCPSASQASQLAQLRQHRVLDCFFR